MTTANLWQKYKKSPSSILKSELMKQYFKLVYYVIHKTDLRNDQILDERDYYQFGILGLSEAIDRFNPAYGVKFETYAIPRIRGMILDEIRKLDFIPRSYKENLKKELESENATRRKTQRDELTINDYLKEFQTISLSQEVGEDSDTLIELISNQEDSPVEEVEKEDLKGMILKEINSLPEKHRLILTLYYYEDMNYQEIADVLEISVSRVSQIHSDLMKKLKKKISKLVE
ncbi:MAG: sigma-70 family RNA polymerase sigma factor [Ignavibacteria bacterium]|nr:sigma-70 family RNA polymerase sigma factor [Ignavibacteria bacterium]